MVGKGHDRIFKANRRNASLILIQPSGPPVASRARRQGEQIGLVTSGIGGLAEMPDLRLQATRLTRLRSPALDFAVTHKCIKVGRALKRGTETKAATWEIVSGQLGGCLTLNVMVTLH
jgi:hypothetical protein